LKLQRAFGVKISFRQLLEDLPTIEAVAAHLDAELPPEPAPVAAKRPISKCCHSCSVTA